MSWRGAGSYPRAILHIDGDAFFASCEVAKDPRLRGRAVITGKERGIVSSLTYEAKRLGIRRSMALHEIKRRFPEVVILASDYETYSIVSQRMYEIVRRYTPSVEEYSIDECFADITGLRRLHRVGYEEIAARIKRDLERELGMTFSIGLSCTKTLAKIGSKWKKPDGLTVMPLSGLERFLRETSIEKVWGIGPNTAAYLQKFGIRSAYDFTRRGEEWVVHAVSKPYVEIWHELQGRVKSELETEKKETYQTISKTKTFTPPSRDDRFLFSELSKNVENACIKARRWHLAARGAAFFLKTQEFRYAGAEVSFPISTNVPQDVLAVLAESFRRVYRSGVEYRATGVTLLGLEREENVQLDLFGGAHHTQRLRRVFAEVDALDARYGKHSIFLGSSLHALGRSVKEGERGGPSTVKSARFRGETARRRLGAMMLGDVR